MSFLYIFGKDTSIPFRRHRGGEKKEITSDVNENDDRWIERKRITSVICKNFVRSEVYGDER